eukprot:TRINITY_DN63215_c0_g1_i1.p1 TRINITY_DN63215_c0_g1~~TRINITY_DN63215_c0_g1_i1.p1  ORF type:complete len:1371 (-),score=379.48 TRINITY_DN63215_c0_g1_i1:639-4751(-)
MPVGVTPVDKMKEDLAIQASQETSAEMKANCVSRLTFYFVWNLLKVGSRRTMEHNDLLHLRPQERAENVAAAFEKAIQDQRAAGTPINIQKAIVSVFRRQMIVAGMIKSVNTAVQVIPFVLMKWFLMWMSETPTPGSENDFTKWETLSGYVYILLIWLCMQIKAVAENVYFHCVTMVGLQLRTAVVQSVFRKSLRLSLQARQGFTTGEIVNLMQLWALRLEMFAMQCHNLWDGMVQIICYMSLAIWLVGVSAVAGFVIMFLLLPINAKAMKKISVTRHKVAAQTDIRVKMVNEIFQGIRAIKMYAWETPWGAEVEEVRKTELKFVRGISGWKGIMRGLMMSTPQMILLTVFTVYSLAFGETMTPERVFSAMAVFMNVRMSLMFYPMALAGYIDAKQAIRRLQTYLTAIENDEYVKEDGMEIGGVSVAGGTFAYRKEGVVVNRDGFDPAPKKDKKKKGKKDDKSDAATATTVVNVSPAGEGSTETEKERLEVLRDVNVELLPGQLAAVIGPVGSGKSSLANAILGELCCLNGEVKRRGSVAYAPQSPWILNATVKDNILFGSDFDEQRYEKVISCCQLRADIALLQDGDLTEIGERGITLSGGQKQRVSLARTLYAKADIYIFDDPLSALDAEVGKAVFEQAIMGFCKGKTRIFMTHAVHTLKQCDRIVQLAIDEKDGCGFVTRVSSPEQISLEDQAEMERQVSGGSAAAEAKDVQEDAGKAKNAADAAAAKNVAVVPAPAKAEAVAKKATGELVKKERKEEGRVSFKVYYGYAKAVKSVGYIVATIIAYLANRVLTDMSTFWFATWTADEYNTEQWVYATAFAGFTVLTFVSAYVSAITMVYLSARASQHMHGDLYEALVRAPLSFFDTTPVGRIINRFSQDMENLDNMLPEQLGMFFMVMLSVFGMLGSMAVAVPLFAITLPVFLVIYAAVVRTYQSSMRDAKRLDSVALSPIYSSFQQVLGGLSTIRAYGSEKRFEQECVRASNHYNRANYSVKALQRWLSVRLESLGATMLLAVGLLAAYQRGSMAAGFAGVAVTYSLQITGVLNWTVRTLSEVEAVMACVERILEYSTTLPRERPYSSEGPDAKAAQLRPPAQGWPSQGALSLQDVKVRYRPDTPIILKGLNLEIAAGERVGVVGRTGSGKSTLMLALLRLVEAEGGSVSIDGTDIGSMGLGDLRSAVSIVPQEATLWSGSLRKNLDPFSRASDNDIWAALEKVEMRSALASRFPDAALSDIAVSEYGENFSQGQRQLFCLVRALLRNSRVLLMDEATSALDHETDALIQRTIRECFADRTILVVAHRLRTVADCDRIVVLGAGEVLELGPPSELLRKEGGELASLVAELGKDEAAEILALADAKTAAVKKKTAVI